MRKIVFLLIIAVLILTAARAVRRYREFPSAPPPPSPIVPPPAPPLTPPPAPPGAPVAACEVKDITKITQGYQADWSPDGRMIAYSKLVNGNQDVFVANLDGSQERCLTCGDAVPEELRGKHKGFPDFNAVGTYISFLAENEHAIHTQLSIGTGVNTDLWVANYDGTAFWRMTGIPAGSAIQFPLFSFNGKRFVWSERYERGNILAKGREFGFWKIKVADFVITPDGPRFKNEVELEPAGRGFYEPHSTSPDGRKIIFAGVFDPTKSQLLSDIYTYDLETKVLARLTHSDDVHDEQARYSPSGRKISLMSGPFIGLLNFVYRTDLYLMDADGAHYTRLTYFNEPGHPEYTGANTLMNKNSWNADGTKLISSYYIHERREQTIFTVTFQGACGSQ